MVVINVLRTSMGVRFEIPIRAIEVAVLRWAEENLHAPKMGRVQGRTVIEAGDGYYAFIPSMHMFHFHRAYFSRVCSIISQTGIQYGLDIKIQEHQYVRREPYRCSFDNHGFAMHVDDPESRFFYQNEVVDRATDAETEQIVFAIQTGRGKSLANGTHVRVPGGWKRIEDLKVGDLVIGDDGKPTVVLGVYPQPVRELFKVTFDDGRSVVACGEHLWKSFYINTTENRRWGIRDTNEIRRLISMPNPRVYIPLPEPEETTEKEFYIDPYLMGAILGNGSWSGGSVFFSTADSDTLELVRSKLPENHVMKPTANYDHIIVRKDLKHAPLLMCGLRDYELDGAIANSKFIPSVYFEGSIEQRWEILRGLMDTDGTVNKDGGQPSFCSVSRDLAYGVVELVRSLGGIASVSTKIPTYSYKGEKRTGQPAYIVFIRHKTPSMLFNLERKKLLCRDNGQYTATLKLRVTSIESIGDGDSTCIAVDNESHLFVVKDWIVTHNTKSAQKVMVKKGVRTVLIHRPTYKDKWVFDCVEDETGLRIEPHEIHIAQGTQGIYDAVQDGRDGVLDEKGIKVIIIPTVSLSNFLKEYYNTAAASMITPETFYDDLGAGAVVYDEVHEHFFLVYMSAVLLNPPFLLDMSATLTPGKSKKFIADRYLERFPMPTRVSVPYMPVVDCRGIYYSIDDKQLANRIQRVNPYNHKLVEQLMFKHHLMESFFEMVWDMIQKSYLKGHQKGQKALVFFALVESCLLFKQYIDKKIKELGLDLVTAKYNAGDSYDDFIAADIGVSTPGKAGTAIDIPGLVQVYVTIPIDDQQLNEQVAGRPRVDFKWGLTPKVWFLHALEVPKHMAYLQSRQTSLAGVVKSFMTAFSPYVIRKKFHATNPYADSSGSSVRRNGPGKVSGKRSKRVPRNRGRRR